MTVLRLTPDAHSSDRFYRYYGHHYLPPGYCLAGLQAEQAAENG